MTFLAIQVVDDALLTPSEVFSFWRGGVNFVLLYAALVYST